MIPTPAHLLSSSLSLKQLVMSIDLDKAIVYVCLCCTASLLSFPYLKVLFNEAWTSHKLEVPSITTDIATYPQLQ